MSVGVVFEGVEFEADYLGEFVAEYGWLVGKVAYRVMEEEAAKEVQP